MKTLLTIGVAYALGALLAASGAGANAEKPTAYLDTVSLMVDGPNSYRVDFGGTRSYRGTLPSGALITGVVASENFFFLYGQITEADYAVGEVTLPMIWRIANDPVDRRQRLMRFPLETEGAFSAATKLPGTDVVFVGEQGIVAIWDGAGWAYYQIADTPDLEYVEVDGAGWRARDGSGNWHGPTQNPGQVRRVGFDGQLVSNLPSVKNLMSEISHRVSPNDPFAELWVQLERAIVTPSSPVELQLQAKGVLFRIRELLRPQKSFAEYLHRVRPIVDRLTVYGETAPHYFAASPLFTGEDRAKWIETLAPRLHLTLRSLSQDLSRPHPYQRSEPEWNEPAAFDLENLIRDAVHGKPGAQIDLAFSYFHGIGLSVDAAAGNYWLTRAGGGTRRLFFGPDRSSESYRKYVETLASMDSIIFEDELKRLEEVADAVTDEGVLQRRAERGHFDSIEQFLKLRAKNPPPNWRELLVKLYRSRPETAEALYLEYLIRGVSGPVSPEIIEAAIEKHLEAGTLAKDAVECLLTLAFRSKEESYE